MSNDLALIAYVITLCGVAILLPERLWPRLARVVARVGHGARPRQAQARLERLEDWGLASDAKTDDILVAAAANDLISRLVGLRCALARSWSPRVRLVGREHIERATEAGQGVILWVAPTCWHTVATKAALFKAGFRVSHLSTTEHGFSGSRAAVRFLNPLWVRGERRFVAERLVMSPHDRNAALRDLVDRVRSGGVVSMTAGSQGQRTHDVPMLGGTIRLAGGPASLAMRTGGSLLPVWTVRDADGTYVTTVAPPLESDGADRRHGERSLAAAYAAVIGRMVADHPAEWQAWRD